MSEPTVEDLLEEGCREGVFTHAAVAAWLGGELVLSLQSRPGTALVFDVASVTKVVTATLAHGLDLAPVLPSISPLDLLAHRSGLPAWRPFFAHAAKALGVNAPALFSRPEWQARAREHLRSFLLETPRDATKPTYSDLGFLLLGLAIEDATGRSIADVGGDLFARLGLDSMRWGGPNADAVPTGRGRPRSGNPEVERAIIEAAGADPDALDHLCDDDNAASLGGRCGHAGLWSNAPDLSSFGGYLLRLADADARYERLFTRVEPGSRTFGLDTPSGDTPAIGSLLGRGPRGAAGHLGFTGCSLWLDRDADLSIALLSNAVALARPNLRIRPFRPRIHDAVARRLGLGGDRSDA